MTDYIRRNLRIVIFAVVIIALLIALYIIYGQASSAKDDRDVVQKQEQNVRSNLIINRTQYDVVELQRQKDELQAGYTEFPSSVPVVDFTNYLADGANQFYPVTITASQPAAKAGSVTIGGKSYPAYETTMTVKGELSGVIAYLQYVEEGAYSSVKADSVSIARYVPPKEGEEEEQEQDSNLWTCSFNDGYEILGSKFGVF